MQCTYFVDNELYFEIAEDLSVSSGLDESHPSGQVERQLTEILNHTYQLDSGSSESRSNEPAYAEVGRVGVAEIVSTR